MRVAEGFAGLALCAAIMSGCEGYRHLPDSSYYVRESRYDEVAALVEAANRDPASACDELLPAAMRSGRFNDGAFACPVTNSGVNMCSEMKMLAGLHAESCECKTNLSRWSPAKRVAVQDVPALNLAQLADVLASFNQSDEVQRAASGALMARAQSADAQELGPTFRGGAEGLMDGNAPKYDGEYHLCMGTRKNGFYGHPDALRALKSRRDALRLAERERRDRELEAAGRQEEAARREKITAAETRAAEERRAREANLSAMCPNSTGGPAKLSRGSLLGLWVDVENSNVVWADWQNANRLGGFGVEFSPCEDRGDCAAYGAHEVFSGFNTYKWMVYSRVRAELRTSPAGIRFTSAGIDLGGCSAVNVSLGHIGNACVAKGVKTVALECDGGLNVKRLIPLRSALTFMSRYSER